MEPKHSPDHNPIQQENQSPPPPPKKQVRRRLHTSRPYQERLLNMAEARREIVAALKFHRATMKQQQQQQQQQHIQQNQSHQVPPYEASHEEMKRNHRFYPTNPNNHYDHLHFPNFITSPPPQFSWPYSQIPPQPIFDNLNFTLPNQPLGLNLNLQDFNNINTSLYNNNNPSVHTFSSMSPLSSSDGPSTDPSVADMVEPTIEDTETMHPTMDDEQMAEIRLIGEKHEMEWNDTMNLVTSAWWSRFFDSMEGGGPAEVGDGGFGVLDHQLADVPDWLYEPRLDDYCYYSSDECLQDSALPSLDIGEIEAMDGDCRLPIVSGLLDEVKPREIHNLVQDPQDRPNEMGWMVVIEQLG
ncbi:hypothetical protein QJS10_CPA06g02541 [Acorus calamus]|uniref:Uncharacterized protein n=1 Tax=Acorus calamus TaxID=4465 RepID=A0AAV9EI05_ACOCL|nr:hypothetical protein QJS10_CPA06g02541 [Acorus calamus]